jgi:hypothetical protein
MRQQDERGFVKTRYIPLREAVPCVVVMLSVRHDQLNGDVTYRRHNFNATWTLTVVDNDSRCVK